MEEFKKYESAMQASYRKQLKDLLMQGFVCFGLDFVFEFAQDLCKQAREYYLTDDPNEVVK